MSAGRSLESTATRQVAPAGADRHRQQIRAEQVRILFEQLPSALIATAIVGALIVYVLWGHVPPSWLLLWLLALAMTIAARAGLRRAYLRVKPPVVQAERWGRRFLASEYIRCY